MSQKTALNFSLALYDFLYNFRSCQLFIYAIFLNIDLYHTRSCCLHHRKFFGCQNILPIVTIFFQALLSHQFVLHHGLLFIDSETNPNPSIGRKKKKLLRLTFSAISFSETSCYRNQKLNFCWPYLVCYLSSFKSVYGLKTIISIYFITHSGYTFF